MPFIEDLGATGDDVLHWRLAFNMNNARDDIYSNTFHLSPQHVAPLQIYQCYGLDAVVKSEYTNAVMTASSTAFSDNFWDEDLYVDGLDSATANDQVDDLKRVMLGKDFNWTTAILRIDDQKPIQGSYYVATKYSTFDTFKLDVNRVRMGSSRMWYFDDVFEVVHTNPVRMDWRLPGMEKYDFKK